MPIGSCVFDSPLPGRQRSDARCYPRRASSASPLDRYRPRARHATPTQMSVTRGEDSCSGHGQPIISTEVLYVNVAVNYTRGVLVIPSSLSLIPSVGAELSCGVPVCVTASQPTTPHRRRTGLSSCYLPLTYLLLKRRSTGGQGLWAYGKLCQVLSDNDQYASVQTGIRRDRSRAASPLHQQTVDSLSPPR